jgi:asparagine synthase (glutamine-hydrolysing)
MCGIAGIYNPYGLTDALRDKELLKQMTLSMDHRGPDEKGVLYSDTGYIGHARLSIIDIETGQQPMYSKDYNLGITFNGEIFNYPELRKGLKEKNYNFHTTSDTEVLLCLYREYGIDMIDRLNGQFAFAIIDFSRNKIFLARDRVGIRPLFYTIINGTLIFSSCIKTILMHPKVDAAFGYKAYHQSVHIWTTYGDETFFKDINSIKPGEFLEYSKDGVSKKIYWDLSFDDGTQDLTCDDWKEKISESLNQAVQLRRRADVPVNAYLSGGLDSAITLKLIQGHHPERKLESYSVGFTDKVFDETYYQQLMNSDTGIKNTAVMISPKDIGDIFKQVVWHAEQPVFRTAPAPLYHLSGKVNDKGYKVVMTGEGADEVAWGYNIFKETQIRYHMAKDPDNQEWISRIPSLYPYQEQFNKRHLHMLAGFYKQSLTNTDSPLFSHSVRISNGKRVLNFVNPDIREELARFDIEEDIIPTLPGGFCNWSPLQKTQYLEMKTLLTGYLLSSQGDRMSMAHSVEGRYPFLDHNIVELFAKIPDRLKLNGMKEKFILKETFRDILPEEITDRSKHPYRAPEAISLLTENILEAYLNESEITKQNFFNWKFVNRLIDKLQKNRTNVSFNDNFTFINIASTTMFISFLNNEFIHHPKYPDRYVHETEVN